MNRLRYVNGDIDSIDEQILNALTEDARTSVAKLARRIGMSAPAISERIKRLEEAGVITAYTVAIDHKAIGLPIAAWLRVRPVPGQLNKVCEILSGIPEITECDRITGEDCFLARACVCSVEGLEKVIDKIIPYAMTNTSIIQSSPVSQRLPPLVN